MNKVMGLIGIILCLLLSGCNLMSKISAYAMDSTIEQSSPQKNGETLTAEQFIHTPLNVEIGTHITLKDIGLVNVEVIEKKAVNIVNGRYAYLLRDYMPESTDFYNVYLVVETENTVLFQSFETGNLESTMYVCDIDGDGKDNIIVQRLVDEFGGAGTFCSHVFALEQDQIISIFNSDLYFNTEETSPWDTGYSSEFISDRMIRISNRITGYQEDFDISSYYRREFFDNNGVCTLPHQITCDSFMQFFPEDIDDDSISEIVCLQYVSLGGHADGIGYAKSVLKYDTQAQHFAIVVAEFILST